MALALKEDPSDAVLASACDVLAATRPTAGNLHWALQAMREALQPLPPGERLEAALLRADRLADEDVDTCRAIGEQALPLLERTAVGQGFCDEVFRVWARDNPGTRLVPVNMNEDVGWFVRKAYADAQSLP